MQNDKTKKTDQPTQNDRPADKVEEIPAKPVSEGDANSVKGGGGSQWSGGPQASIKKWE